MRCVDGDRRDAVLALIEAFQAAAPDAFDVQVPQ